MLRAALSSLPDGSGFSPTWRPKEDVYLGDALISQGLKCFDCPGLASTMDESSDDARDSFGEIAEYMANGYVREIAECYFA